MRLDIVKECDGGFTQPSAVSDIRQDTFRLRKVEESTIDTNSKDAGIQFRDLVEKTQDEINDYIDITGWDNIPSKVKITIQKFQTEFDRIINEYSTPPREIPLYKVWNMMTKEEQDKLLKLVEVLSHLLDDGFIVKNNLKIL